MRPNYKPESLNLTPAPSAHVNLKSAKYKLAYVVRDAAILPYSIPSAPTPPSTPESSPVPSLAATVTLKSIKQSLKDIFFIVYKHYGQKNARVLKKYLQQVNDVEVVDKCQQCLHNIDANLKKTKYAYTKNHNNILVDLKIAKYSLECDKMLAFLIEYTLEDIFVSGSIGHTKYSNAIKNDLNQCKLEEKLDIINIYINFFRQP